jgi:hypothetical protein
MAALVMSQANHSHLSIQRYISHLKELDIFSKRPIFIADSTQFSIRANFQHNRNLQEMALKAPP